MQWFNGFGLTDEARESLSDYLKAAQCSKAGLAPSAVRKVCGFVTKLPWHLLGCISPGLARGHEKLQVTVAASLQGQSLKLQQIICQTGFPFVVLAMAWDLQ